MCSGALPYSITAITTLTHDDPRCSRSLKLSALVFRLGLNRPHPWSLLPHTPGLLRSLSVLLLSVKASLLSHWFCLHVSPTLMYTWPAPNACWPCWFHYVQNDFTVWDKWTNGKKKQKTQRWEETWQQWKKDINEKREKPDIQGCGVIIRKIYRRKAFWKYLFLVQLFFSSLENQFHTEMYLQLSELPKQNKIITICTSHEDNTKPLDVTVAPFHPPVSWSTNTNLCVWTPSVRGCMLTLLCLNCTAAMCRKSLYSYYYSGPIPHFPSPLSVCNSQKPQHCRRRGGARKWLYCCSPACIHYAASEPGVLPAGSSTALPIKNKCSYCYCCNNCNGGDAWKPDWQNAWQWHNSDIMYKVSFILS